MFGLNDDDKMRADQRQDQNDTRMHTDEHADKSISDSPFAAAYSSLNADDPTPAPAASPAPARSRHASMVPEEDLLQIKTQALQSLAPLVNHLDQTPEEKFKTTMMMIQASDNADLIREAYQAANSIDDEKARAQALLDVINEINYFTQRGKN
ncbi:MAG TPA: hypothetical protein VG964_04375 [Candidatus Saccharimonadales bacterium]|nr:hypothetical protein [Candidatus Saccharimonadales bacterium]